VTVSLQTRIGDLITAVGTDIKQFRTWLTGSASGDLTGLATTDKTSIVNAINEVNTAAASASVPDATTTVKGKIEIATLAEVGTGTDTVRAVTPEGVRQERTAIEAELSAGYQPLDADLTAIAAIATTAYGRAFLALANQAGLQALLGLDTDTALAANSDAKIATQKAVKAYADGLLDANNAYQYKGVIDCSANPNYPAASAGWTYKVSVAGKIGGASGTNVEVGDTLTCIVDGSAAGNQATVGANWIIVQTNIDGAVTGPASSTAGDIVTFSGTTGKVIQDSAVAISTDGTMAANSNAKVPTEAAIRTYLGANYYTQTQLGNPDTDLAALYTTAKT
jgi:hypothetical protein